MKQIIISSKPGQLGNSLFLFSHFIAFGLEKNYKIINPAFNKYSAYFHSTNTKLNLPYYIAYYIGRILCRLKINNRFIKCIYLDWDETMNLCNAEQHFDSRLNFVQGWSFRCGEYIKRYHDDIKRTFTPKPSYLQRIDKIIPNARKNCDVLIGLHVRHGDYKNFEGGKFYYTVEQYKNLITKTSALFPGKKISLLICSNSSENLSLLYTINTIKGLNHELEDMYSFAECDYLIGPPSTYTMWASFYGSVPLYQVHDINADITLEKFKVITDG